jgi:hypothetical protein
MNFYLKKNEKPAFCDIMNRGYDFPKFLLQLGIPCDVYISSSKFMYMSFFTKRIYKKYQYIESYSNQFEAILHLNTMKELIETRDLKIFSLFFIPIFDVRFDNSNIVLSVGRGKFYESIYIFDILKDIQKCIDDAMSITKIDYPEFDDFINKETVRLISDLKGIGYAA